MGRAVSMQGNPEFANAHAVLASSRALSLLSFSLAASIGATTGEAMDWPDFAGVRTVLALSNAFNSSSFNAAAAFASASATKSDASDRPAFAKAQAVLAIP